MLAQFKNDLDQDMRRAARAKELLEDPILANAFQELDAEIIAAWRGSVRPEEREALHHRMKVLEAFRGKLEILMGNGDKAKHDLQSMARREKFGVNL